MGEALSEAAQSLQASIAEAHLDVDTGIGRAGVQISEALARRLPRWTRLPNLRITGLATHFASADEDPADARAQHGSFPGFLHSLGARADTLLDPCLQFACRAELAARRPTWADSPRPAAVRH